MVPFSTKPHKVQQSNLVSSTDYATLYQQPFKFESVNIMYDIYSALSNPTIKLRAFNELKGVFLS